MNGYTHEKWWQILTIPSPTHCLSSISHGIFIHFIRSNGRKLRLLTKEGLENSTLALNLLNYFKRIQKSLGKTTLKMRGLFFSWFFFRYGNFNLGASLLVIPKISILDSFLLCSNIFFSRYQTIRYLLYARQGQPKLSPIKCFIKKKHKIIKVLKQYKLKNTRTDLNLLF